MPGLLICIRGLERNVGPAVAESSGYCCPSTPDLALTSKPYAKARPRAAEDNRAQSGLLQKVALIAVETV